VAYWLIKEKVDAQRITWKGYGETMPLAKGITEVDRATNRRVEFKVVER
jgi:outer membrane protein OmpA-like peptidoglycan-associated protein